jgi:diguanylate cyclase (GGDEF)-like protein/PAS domain S-box-containing protein
MEHAVLIALLNNAALLLMLSVIYEATYFIPNKYRRFQNFISGILVAIICVAIMSVPFTIQPGIVYDTRSILISVTGLIFGPVPTIITVVAASVLRLSSGGAGAIPGLAVIVSSALIGLAWRRWLLPKTRKLRWLSTYAMSVIVHLVMIACMLLLPYPDNLKIISQIFLPVMLIYPVASVLLNMLLIRQQEIRGTQDQLKQSEERFQLLFEKAPLGYQSMDENGNLIEVNQKWLDMFGFRREDVIGKWFGDFLDPASRSRFMKNFPLFKEVGKTQIEHIIPDSQGKSMTVSIEGKIAYDYDGTFKQTHCILQDITERKQTEDALKASERKYRQITDNITDVVWTTDLNMKTTFVSPSIERLLGDSVEKHMSRGLEEKFPPWSLKKIQKILEDELINDENRDKNRSRVIEIEHYHANGTIIWLGMNVSIMRDSSGRPIGFMGVSRDITELKKTQDNLQYMIDHDDLTGVFNRRRYENEILRLDTEDMLPLSIIIADINGLKLINDSFGHTEGDKIISTTAKIISSCCREGDILARTGGDEFSILMPNTDNQSAVSLVNSIQSALDQHNSGVADEAYRICLSYGADTKYDLSDNFIQVQKRAEDYLNQSKLLNKNSSYSSIISSVKATMQEKSQETEAHSERIAKLARIIGIRLNLSQIELDHIELLATLHDIGKVGIAEQILKKPGKLDQNEWNEMKKHPEIGYRIAMSTPNLAPIASYILCHHERWDGAGYPQNLKGLEIPLLSRIIAVVDAYDAMTAERIYRKPITHDEAIEEIKKHSGLQFDPEIVRIFIEHFGTAAGEG